MLLQAAPSWDLIIAIVFVVGSAFGFIMQRDRVLVTLFSLYAGLVIAGNLAGPVEKFFNGDTAFLNKLWVQSSASPFMIKTAIFAAVIMIIGAKANLGRGRGTMGALELAGYSFFNVGLGLWSLFSFMKPADQQTYIHASKFAALVISHQTLWIVGPLVLLLALGNMRRTSYRDDY